MTMNEHQDDKVPEDGENVDTSRRSRGSRLTGAQITAVILLLLIVIVILISILTAPEPIQMAPGPQLPIKPIHPLI